MSTDPAASVRHAQGIHDAIAGDLAGLGGELRCGECGGVYPLTTYGIAVYLREGWPKCHGYTMTWVTQRELDEEDK